MGSGQVVLRYIDILSHQHQNYVGLCWGDYPGDLATMVLYIGAGKMDFQDSAR